MNKKTWTILLKKQYKKLFVFMTKTRLGISFYNHFSSKNYRDFELNKTDLMLEALEKETFQSWRDKSPKELADYLHTDYLVYGRAKEYKKLFLGIYSQIALRVYVEIVDGSNGDIIFSKDILTEKWHLHNSDKKLNSRGMELG